MAETIVKDSGQKGFTLLEIMVSLAIISIAMIAMLSLGNRSIGVHDRLQRLTQATLLAQQKMSESELKAKTGGVAQLQESSGDFADPFAEYRWHIELNDTPLPSVQMVTVKVLWGDEDRNEGVDVTSFLF
jgi:general secretion pathway protein I